MPSGRAERWGEPGPGCLGGGIDNGSVRGKTEKDGPFIRQWLKGML